MTITANRWQSEIRKPANGTQPSNTTYGTLVTASGTAHTKGSWSDVIVAGDWSGFTGDAFEIEILFTASATSATIIRVLADIGIDTGGGYASIIDNLGASFATTLGYPGSGIYYRFNLRIPNGAKVGCRCQSNVISQTVYVAINVFGNPTHPGLVRSGTLVRTFGADTANTQGTGVTPGGASEGAWVQVTASTSDDLWQWDASWHCNDSAWVAGSEFIDIGKGAAASEVVIATNITHSKGGTEGLVKPTGPAIYDVPSGTRIAVRAQGASGETTETVIVYGVGGYAVPGPFGTGASIAGAYTISGSITVNGAPAPTSTGTVWVEDVEPDFHSWVFGYFDVDASGNFSIDVPFSDRYYRVFYWDDATSPVIGYSFLKTYDEAVGLGLGTSWNITIEQSFVEVSMSAIQKFTASGTYTPTSGTTAVKVRLVGGGGGGGAAITTNGVGGTGGGSGEYAELFITGSPVTGGTVTIGAAGSAGTTGGANGGNGGTTSVVINGTTYSVSGGTGGLTVNAFGAGHSAAAPTLGSTAQDVSRSVVEGLSNFLTTTTAVAGGNGANSPLGRGGRGGNGGNTAGEAATGYGSGGGGGSRATTNQAGGAGSAGFIVIEEYLTVPTAAQIADAVWDEPTSGHTTAGTFGKSDADILAAVDTEVAAIKAKTDQLTFTTANRVDSQVFGMQANTITDAATAADFEDKIADKVWDEPVAGHVTAGTFGKTDADTLAAVDTEVAAIKAKTDQLTFTTANRVDSQVFGMQANTVTASAVAADAIGASELAADAVAEIQSGLATSAAVALVQADADDIQTRLPAALVGGRMDSSVGAMAANVLTAAATAADFGTEIAAAVWDAVVEGAHTFKGYMRGMASALIFKENRSGSARTFRDAADTKDRITATATATARTTTSVDFS